MKTAISWKKVKPSAPGKYFTRVAGGERRINEVIVTKTGRGLSVFCAAYNDRVAMSKIGDSEFEWALAPKNLP